MPSPPSSGWQQGGGLLDMLGNALGGNLGGIAGGLAGVAVAAVGRSLFNTIRHPRGHDVVVGACQRDPHDPDDRHYDRHLEVGAGDLPDFVDLREHMTTVEDQGALGSCTANAIAGAYEYLEKRITGQEGDVSRLFIYYMERKMEGNENEDTGATLRNGMKVLQSYGVCSEQTWPYHIKAFKHEPHSDAVAEAAEHTIDEYHRIPVEEHPMKVCLAEGYPFVFGTKIWSSFEAHGHHGRIQVPRSGEKDLGSHAMLVCGYSDRDRVFLVRNSWGSDWGDRGYCYIPYDYLTNTDWTHDLWTLRRAHNLDFSQSGRTEQWGGSGGGMQGRSFFSEVAQALGEITASGSYGSGSAAEWHRRRAEQPDFAQSYVAEDRQDYVEEQAESEVAQEYQEDAVPAEEAEADDGESLPDESSDGAGAEDEQEVEDADEAEEGEGDDRY